MKKHELDARLSFLVALEGKLPAMTLEEQEKDTLLELLEAQRARESDEWLRARAEEAVSCLFPTWRGGRIETPKHPMWHEKSWWWNGASIEELAELSNGDVVLNLSSYVGCGDTDTLYGLVLKREWLEADDMPGMLNAYMASELERRNAEKQQQALARAQAELRAAQAQVTRLQGA